LQATVVSPLKRWSKAPCEFPLLALLTILPLALGLLAVPLAAHGQPAGTT
jgi:hypothetical protein